MIKVGDKLPAGSLQEFIEVEGNGCSLGPNTFEVEASTAGKKIAIFGLPVNSFWLSGCGRRQDVEGEEPHADTRLRAPLLSEDWAAWAEAWRALDADALAPLADALERGEPASLTLCGERFAQRFELAEGSLWSRLGRRFKHPGPADVLEAL